MAPSVRVSSGRVAKRQSSVRTNAKISKATKVHPAAKAQLEDAAFKPVVVVKKPGNQTAKHAIKRKRGEVDDDSELEMEGVQVTKVTSKKTKVQLPTPPSSQRRSPIELELSPSISFRQLSLHSSQAPEQALPLTLRDFVSLHSAFLKAFSLHLVHNGQSVPANLDNLMSSITRLWKKHTVTRDDIQRILAIYELDVSTHFSGQLLKHQDGPFKLTRTGSDNIRCNIEYVGWGNNRTSNSQWDEYNLQQLYEAGIESLWIASRSNPTCWVNSQIVNFPKLDFEMGAQSQQRKSKAEATRRDVLGLSTQGQNQASAKSASQTTELSRNNETEKPQMVKDRTMSLLDRVRAKAAASASSTSQTPEAITRRYALGRISEVVEILRMKQQRKLSSGFVSSVHSSPSKVRFKVSFSLNQLILDIKGSLQVPLGDAELRMCFKILQDDLPGTWLSMYSVGSVQSVILNGSGLSGIEVKRILDEQEKMR